MKRIDKIFCPLKAGNEYEIICVLASTGVGLISCCHFWQHKLHMQKRQCWSQTQNYGSPVAVSTPIKRKQVILVVTHQL